MADPLSIAASVAGLITLAAQIASTAKTLYTSIKDAPESLRKIDHEMDDMHVIFCEVQLFIAGEKRRTRDATNRLTMISLHHFMATLSGCVLVCTKLDKKISEVAGIQNTGTNTGNTQTAGQSNFLQRVKWALWKEAETAEIIEELQRHKLSLSLMLNIIQCKNSTEASDKLGLLHEVVAQILDSNRDISRHLRELIKRQDTALDIPSADGNYTGPSSTPGGYNYGTMPLSAASDLNSTASPCDDDTASIRTTSSIRSTLSFKSFTQDLMNSRAYKRLDYSRRSRSTSQSTFSLDSSGTKGDSWSMLSDLSLGGLSISEISVVELPISLSDLHDPKPFQSIHYPPQRQKRSLVGVSWASKGRLHNAVTNDNLFLVRSLLNLGANVGEIYNGKTPLELSLQLELLYEGRSSLSICKELLDWGAEFNFNSADSSGRTPLSYAAQQGKTKTCELFLAQGADVNSADFSGRTPLSYSAEYDYHSSLEICKLLLDQGADVNSADHSGRTPLSYAVEYNYYSETWKLLLDRGANVNYADSSGRTPLSYSAEKGSCMLLLDRGADVNSADFSGRTPLSYAAGKDWSEICKLLLDRGAFVNSTDSLGRTPLSYAAEKGWRVTCKLLLDYGAEHAGTDSRRGSHLSHAAVAGEIPTCRVLMDRSSLDDIDSADFTGSIPAMYTENKEIVGLYNSRIHELEG